MALAFNPKDGESNYLSSMLMTRADFDRLISQGTEFRYEWRDGRIYAMSGDTGPHSKIFQNVVIALTPRLGDRGPCRLYNDRYVEIPPHKGHPDGAVALPDAVVSCMLTDWKRPKQKGQNSTTIRSPRVIVEVLSEGSTARYDRTDKLVLYQQCPSLEVYILLSQEEEEALVYRRASNWAQEIYHSEMQIDLPELGTTLLLSELYKGVFDDVDFSDEDD